MKPFRFCKKLTEKYTLDFSGFHKMPHDPYWSPMPLADFDLWLSYDEKRHDHAPAIHIYFEVLGFVLVDFDIYNINHAENEIS